MTKQAKRYVYFRLAGNYFRIKGKVFVTSHNRCYDPNGTIYHRNRFTTYLRIPEAFYKANFQYNRKIAENPVGKYETNCRWNDVRQFMFVYDHDKHSWVNDKEMP